MEGAGRSHQQVFQASLICQLCPRPLRSLPSNTDQMNFMQSIHHSLPSANHLVSSFMLSPACEEPVSRSPVPHSDRQQLLLSVSPSLSLLRLRLCSPTDSSPIIFFLLRVPCRHFAPRFFILCHNFSFPVACIQTIMTMRERLLHLCFQTHILLHGRERRAPGNEPTRQRA